MIDWTIENRLSLAERVQRTLCLFQTAKPSRKRPKVKPGISPWDIEHSATYNETRTQFQTQYDRLVGEYRKLSLSYEERIWIPKYFDTSWMAWAIFEKSGGCVILFGLNPEINTSYLRSYPLPPPAEVIERYNSFALHNFPSNAHLWISGLDLSIDRDISELARETLVPSRCDVDVEL